MHGHIAGVVARYRAALALKQHYADQYADRCLYWSISTYQEDPDAADLRAQALLKKAGTPEKPKQ